MIEKETILVTGGCGYIGSSCAIELLDQNYDVVIIDDLRNSKIKTLERISEITGVTNLKFYDFDINDFSKVLHVFENESIKGVIHFAAEKSVQMSINHPLDFYENNLGGTINIIKAMSIMGVKNFIFSSSATVYDKESLSPLSEESSLLNPSNPYGKSKLFVEEILKDVCNSDQNLSCGILRYFNPMGAHNSGKIGEEPKNNGGNLGPALIKAMKSENKNFQIFGNDYETRDGTCIRDFIHITDLSKGHVNALKYFETYKGLCTWNLGTGRGHTVLEVIEAFEKISGVKFDIEFCPRREGDIAISYSSPIKAENDLNWKAGLSLNDMLSDLCKWSYELDGKK